MITHTDSGQSSPRIAFVVGVLFVVAGVASCVHIVSTRSDYRTSTAVVIDIRYDPRDTTIDENTSPRRQSVIEYSVDGKKYQSEWAWWTGMKIGDVVSISFNPAKPDAPEEATFFMRLVSGIVPIFLGVAAMIISWFILKRQRT